MKGECAEYPACRHEKKQPMNCEVSHITTRRARPRFKLPEALESLAGRDGPDDTWVGGLCFFPCANWPQGNGTWPQGNGTWPQGIKPWPQGNEAWSQGIDHPVRVCNVRFSSRFQPGSDTSLAHLSRFHNWPRWSNIPSKINTNEIHGAFKIFIFMKNKKEAPLLRFAVIFSIT